MAHHCALRNDALASVTWLRHVPFAQQFQKLFLFALQIVHLFCLLLCSCLVVSSAFESPSPAAPHAHTKVRLPNVIFKALQNIICNLASYHSPLLALGHAYGAS